MAGAGPGAPYQYKSRVKTVRTLKVRRNMNMEPLGFSYPTSKAGDITGTPPARRISSSKSLACPCQTRKVIPVSEGHSRAKVLWLSWHDVSPSG